MSTPKYSWKAEWKAAGLSPQNLTPAEEALAVELQQQNQEFLKRFPPETMLARTRTLTPKRRPSLKLWNLTPLPIAAALAIFWFAGLQTPSETAQERIKGPSAIQLLISRELNGQSEALAPGALIQAGDSLRLAYRVPQTLQGAILSVDGSHTVTTHWAQSGTSRILETGGLHTLNVLYDLDDAPAYEVFFLFYADRPFAIGPLQEILRLQDWARLPPDAFGPNIHWLKIPLIKQARR